MSTIPSTDPTSDADILVGKSSFDNANFSLTNRIHRALWGIVYTLLFRPSPRPFFAWRAALLRAFGAKLGRTPKIYPKAVIWAPWNLIGEDVVAIADEALIYNVSEIYLGSYSIISQQAFLCGASHDIDDPNFTLISAPIRVEAYGWVAARAVVSMGVTVKEGAVLGLGALATKDLEPWTVYGGIPAKKLRERKRNNQGTGGTP